MQVKVIAITAVALLSIGGLYMITFKEDTRVPPGVVAQDNPNLQTPSVQAAALRAVTPAPVTPQPVQPAVGTPEQQVQPVQQAPQQ